MALSRWFAPAVLAAAFGAASIAPAPVHAQSMDTITRAIVDIADVAFRNGQPYDRSNGYGSNEQLIMRRDAYGRPVYYRVVRDDRYNNSYGGYNNAYGGYNNGYNNGYNTGYGRSSPPYGRAYGYYGQAPGQVKCNKHGKCKAQYYDPRYANGHDRYRDDDRYDRDDDRRRYDDRDDD